MRQFPNATKTFTVTRKVVTLANGNRTAVPHLIASGLSVAISALTEEVTDSKSGPQFVAAYRGSTFLDAPIFIGDQLTDETENEADGTPCLYFVQGKSLGPFSMHLRMMRSQPGA